MKLTEASSYESGTEPCFRFVQSKADQTSCDEVDGCEGDGSSKRWDVFPQIIVRVFVVLENCHPYQGCSENRSDETKDGQFGLRIQRSVQFCRIWSCIEAH